MSPTSTLYYGVPVGQTSPHYCLYREYRTKATAHPFQYVHYPTSTYSATLTPNIFLSDSSSSQTIFGAPALSQLSLADTEQLSAKASHHQPGAAALSLPPRFIKRNRFLQDGNKFSFTSQAMNETSAEGTGPRPAEAVFTSGYRAPFAGQVGGWSEG